MPSAYRCNMHLSCAYYVIPCEIQSVAPVACLGARPVTLAATVAAVAVAVGPKALVWAASTTDVTGEVSVPGVRADVINALTGSGMKVFAVSMTAVTVAVSAALDISVVNAVVAAVAMASKLVVRVLWCVDVLSDEVLVVLIDASTDAETDVVPDSSSPVLTAITASKFVTSSVSEKFGS